MTANKGISRKGMDNNRYVKVNCQFCGTLIEREYKKNVNFTCVTCKIDRMNKKKKHA